MGFLKKFKKIGKKLVPVAAGAAGTFFGGPIGGSAAYGISSSLLGGKSGGLLPFASSTYPVTTSLPSGGPMAFNIGGLLGGIGQALGGLQGANVANVRSFGNILSTTAGFLPGPRLPQAMPQAYPYAQQTMAAAGPVMRVGAAVTRGFFQKFPNLATQIQAFRNAGMSQVTRSRLYSMLKRFGPELLISGGILTAAAVSELMMAGPGHRRMNAGNAKALRRSLRRIESFHKLCVRADSVRAPRRRSKPCRSTGATQFVRQG